MVIVDFNYYLEYWSNGEETGEELLNRVCNYIYAKFPKNNFRKLNKNKNKNKNI